jgi:hypothetical protein
MKSLTAAFLALVSLTVVPNLHADDISLTLDTGTGVQTLVGVPGLVDGVNGVIFTNTSEQLGLLSQGDLLASATSVFTATYVDVSGTLGVLNVTDLCATVTVLGKAPTCQNLAFSFTDVTLGDASIIAAVGANINLAVGGVGGSLGSGLTPDGTNLAGASLALGSGQIDFTAPPPPDGNSPVPEPGTLSLMATGLLGAAGAIRRKFAKA